VESVPSSFLLGVHERHEGNVFFQNFEYFVRLWRLATTFQRQTPLELRILPTPLKPWYFPAVYNHTFHKHVQRPHPKGIVAVKTAIDH
jgi:hypothetical protein